MQHEFKFRLKQHVIATDYDQEKPKQHYGMVSRRWLAEPFLPDTPVTGLGATLEEHYELVVMVGKKPKLCEFLAKDLVPAPAK